MKSKISLSCLLAGLLASGCVSGNITSVVETGFGIDVSTDPTTQVPKMRAGFFRSQVYSIPTGKSKNINGQANQAPDVVSEIYVDAHITSTTIHERYAVGAGVNSPVLLSAFSPTNKNFSVKPVTNSVAAPSIYTEASPTNYLQWDTLNGQRWLGFTNSNFDWSQLTNRMQLYIPAPGTTNLPPASDPTNTNLPSHIDVHGSSTNQPLRDMLFGYEDPGLTNWSGLAQTNLTSRGVVYGGGPITNSGASLVGLSGDALSRTELTAEQMRSITAFSGFATKTATVGGKLYAVKYNFDTRSYSVPLTSPLGQPHYDAKINVFGPDGKQVGPEIQQGVYVENGCFEDQPAHWVQEALLNVEDSKK